MGLQQNVAGNGLRHQVGPLAFMAWFLVRASVSVRPTVEGALLDVSEKVGHQVIAQRNTLCTPAQSVLVPGYQCRPMGLRVPEA